MDYEIIDTGIENLGSPIQPAWFDICCSGCACQISNSGCNCGVGRRCNS